VRHAAVLLMAVAVAAAPQTAVIENAGKPLAVPFHCDAEKLDEAGLSCSPEEPCRIYLELSGVEVVGAKVFLTGNLHTATTTLESIVLVSADNGHTWTEPYERMPFTSLEGVQFIDFQRGWIAGETVQPVPRNPFFLITGDGGKTWRRLPVFEEDHPGAVEGFWFGSRDGGRLLIDSGAPADRHELYETTTGGTDWVLRSRSSAPVALHAGHPRDGATDWRIHAERNPSTYRIERRAGGAWQPLAEFLIEPASCAGN